MEELIRDRVVLGIQDDSVRKRLLQEPNLTLQGCLDICRAYESSKTQTQLLQGDALVAHAVSQKHQRHWQNKGKDYGHQSGSQNNVIECKFCGLKHERVKEKCPAWGKQCSKCGKSNHFAKMCMSSYDNSSSSSNRSGMQARRSRPPFRGAQHNVRAIYEDSDDEIMVVELGENTKEENIKAVGNNNETRFQNKIMATFLIEGEPVKMQVDCGATVNVIPRKHVPLGIPIHENAKQLGLFGNKASITSVGTCKLHMMNAKNRQPCDVLFHVVNEETCVPLIGSRKAQSMNLITVQHENIASLDDSQGLDKYAKTKSEVVKKYQEAFSGLGKMPGKVHLEVDDSSPVVMPPRRVPIAVRDKLKEELNRLESLGVIDQVQKPTDWVSGLVVVQKSDGRIRVCIDPQYLNRALKREHYPLPLIEDVLPELASVKVFTKADCKEGFLQCELDDNSSLLTTFQTPWGRYKWRRLPFGVSPAPELFQKLLDQNLECLTGVYKVADDILIVGRGATLQEAHADHDANLDALMKRCIERKIVLNERKFEYKTDRVKFIGHVLTSNGLQVDEDKSEGHNGDAQTGQRREHTEIRGHGEIPCKVYYRPFPKKVSPCVD